MGFFCLHATFICGSCWPNVCRGGVGCPDGPCHGRPGVTNNAREECDERRLLKLVLVPAEVQSCNAEGMELKWFLVSKVLYLSSCRAADISELESLCQKTKADHC